MHKTPGFSQPPLSVEEKLAKEKEFLNFDKNPQEENVKPRPVKESTKAIFIRAPESYWQELQEITRITGLTMNAVCLEILRKGIKNKLKELNGEDAF